MKTLNFTVSLTVTQFDIDGLIRIAIRHGYLRIDPMKSWTDLERKHAMRFAIKHLITNINSSTMI